MGPRCRGVVHVGVALFQKDGAFDVRPTFSCQMYYFQNNILSQDNFKRPLGRSYSFVESAGLAQGLFLSETKASRAQGNGQDENRASNRLGPTTAGQSQHSQSKRP